MSDVKFELDVQDMPDVIPRIVQTIHRRGGSVRSWVIAEGNPWAKVKITARGIENPGAIASNLEKLIDVHRVQIVSSN